jgi:hypothetical protein
MPGGIELGTPNFVQGLMLSPPEGHGRSKPHVKVAEILKSVHQCLGVELRPVPRAASGLDRSAQPSRGVAVAATQPSDVTK